MSCGFCLRQESTSPSIQAHVSYLFLEEFPNLCCQQCLSFGAPSLVTLLLAKVIHIHHRIFEKDTHE